MSSPGGVSRSWGQDADLVFVGICEAPVGEADDGDGAVVGERSAGLVGVSVAVDAVADELACDVAA